MKKYTSGSFTATKYAIYKEDTDTITSFPTEVIADGENASAIVYGNMQQTGTPTPISPIQPSECGDLETTGEHTGQYKIPISSASTTIPVYLGEVQTTRKIGKIELDGTENIIMPAVSSFQLFGVITWGAAECICSHYKSISFDAASRATETGCAVRETSSGEGDRFRICDLSYTDIDTFKTYLQQQYSNGTPVTVWYVLAESTTGTLNEPLRKLGNYADTVTTTIPTIAAADNINVTTTLKPSAVDLTYTGWHKYDDKKRSGGSWGTVTSNAKKKKSLLGSRKTTKGKT